MSATTVQSTTTTPACPSWCSGDHDANLLEPLGVERYVDEHGDRLPEGATEVAVRSHVTTDQHLAWLARDDAMLPDGTWRTGCLEIGIGEGGWLSPDEARALAARLLELVALEAH